MCKENVLTIVAVATLALAIGQVQAETITVPNAEFLIYKPGTNYTVAATFPAGNIWANSVGDNCRVNGGNANYADGTSGGSVDCPGWKGLTGTNDLLNNGVDGSVGYNAFGTWSGGTGTTAESADSLGNIVGGRTYTLSAMVSGPAGPLVLDLRAGGVALTPSSSVTPPPGTVGDWQEISRTYDAVAIADYIGQPMTIVIGTPGEDLYGTRVVFDNVSLSYEVLFQASNLGPADEATDVPRGVVLTWTPGKFAAPTNGHKVYFGESFNDVNDATGGVAQTPNSYTPPQRLDFGTTYYWRVDEVNAPPDSAIFKGEVWSFTVEPFSYPIAGDRITATASSSGIGQGPENTVNGSGLDVNNLDLHSTELTAMWLTAVGETGPAWIQYEFDKVCKLHEMWVWNHNSMLEPAIGYGCKEVTIEYSVDGTDYTTLGTAHEFARGTGAADYAPNTTVDFEGAAAKYVRLTPNSNWGGLLAQYGLSEVRFLYIPVFAREPSPDSGATDVDVDVTLGFRAGREAAKHDVYLSTDEQAVIDGTAPVSTVTEAVYGPLSLDLGTTYYWKINEVNEAETPTTWQGDLWNFTTHEFFIVDDFEDYNDYPPDEIWAAWVDGYDIPTNGSTVGYPDPDWNQGEHYVETTIVHGGGQSMPYFYDNNFKYSEATKTLNYPRDWIKHGVGVLSLWFYGDAANAAERMYVALNGSAVVYHDNPDAALIDEWTEWRIDLQEFAAKGVNLANVNTISIGFGDKNNLLAGGSGMVLFDDIRLYRPAP